MGEVARSLLKAIEEFSHYIGTSQALFPAMASVIGMVKPSLQPLSSPRSTGWSANTGQETANAFDKTWSTLAATGPTPNPQRRFAPYIIITTN